MSSNYLNTKDLLRFIHDTKATYTWYIDGTHRTTAYKDYDIILCGQDLYTEAKEQLLLQLLNTRRRERLLPRTSLISEEDLSYVTEEDYERIATQIMEFNPKKIDEKLINMLKLGKYNRGLYFSGKNRVKELPSDIDYDISELTIRVYTYSHLPDRTEVTGKEKKTSDFKEKVNFPAFVHYAFRDNEWKIVAKSHHNRKEQFSIEHGHITNDLANAYLLQSKRVSYKHNTKGYSYVEDMVSFATLQLVLVGLQFNELFSSNPFAYFTTVITNSFKTILKEEKRVRQTRDTLLMEAGLDPSIGEQIRQEESNMEFWTEVLGNEDYIDDQPEHTFRETEGEFEESVDTGFEDSSEDEAIEEFLFTEEDVDY